MLLHNNAQIDLLRAPGGPVVGLMEHVSFETDRVVLTPGDLLFAYTDGVTEAVDIAGDYFSRKRLQDALLTSGAKTAQHVIEAVSEVLIAFSRGAPQADDITMMALKFDGPRGKGSEQDRSV
jgi:sigma-B regulation protein RsbU (phosphoserine phosphatase)